MHGMSYNFQFQENLIFGVFTVQSTLKLKGTPNISQNYHILSMFYFLLKMDNIIPMDMKLGVCIKGSQIATRLHSLMWVCLCMHCSGSTIMAHAPIVMYTSIRACLLYYSTIPIRVCPHLLVYIPVEHASLSGGRDIERYI